MGKTPKKTKAAKSSKPTRRPSIVSYEDARRNSRKEFNIARGELREGALYDPSEKLDPEPAASPKLSRAGRLAEAKRQERDKRKKARAKAKASKKFDKSYGGQDASTGGRSDGLKGRVFGRSKASAAQPEGGPRAAVYKGEMGSSHKKSNRMQSQGSPEITAPSTSGVKRHSPKIPHKLGIVLCSMLVVAFCAVTLYGPAQQYYHQMRETDRLQAEYAAVAARTEVLQSSIDALQTDAGIEDKAHTDLGYVKANEQTATVKGIDFEDSQEFSSNVLPGSIPAPETWYSPFLDIFFDYGN